MKLLVVSSWFPYPPDNGSKLRAYHLLTALARRHAVTLLSFAEPGEERRTPELKALCETVCTVRSNPYKPLGRLSHRHLFSSTPRSYAQNHSLAMQALVDREAPAHGAAVALQIGAALYLARHDRMPRVLEEIEAGSMRDQYCGQPISVARARHGLTWWKFARFVRQLVGAFDRTTVVSDLERQHLADIGCDMTRVRVVPNGVERSDLLRPNRPVAGRLVYPGSITYSANLDAVQHFLSETFPRIQAARPDVSFRVTGAIGDVDVRRLSADPAVTFTGRLDDVKTLITQCAVCVVPLRKGGGTRLKILESMALGTPVVSTTKGAEGLSVVPERDVLLADSPDAFAAQVLRILNNPLLRARLSASGRNLVGQSYTWDHVGSQLDALIEEARLKDAGRLAIDVGGQGAASETTGA